MRSYKPRRATSLGSSRHVVIERAKVRRVRRFARPIAVSSDNHREHPKREPERNQIDARRDARGAEHERKERKY